MSYNYMGKTILIGDSGVGKSCLASVLCNRTFDYNHTPTIGVDFLCKTLPLQNNETIKLQIWDTAGQERFHAITKSYYIGAHAVVIVFDVTNRTSFQRIPFWINEVEVHGNKDASIFIVGNKSDLVRFREVRTEECEVLAQTFDVPYFEVSSSDSGLVVQAFTHIAKILQTHPHIRLNHKPSNNRTSSCLLRKQNITRYSGSSSCCILM